jgi:DNA-binding NarL/FixJ family response regulator
VDVGLPDGSGLTVVRRARELFPLLPVLVLTGRDDMEVINAAHALRVDLACKPIDREEIVRFVEGALALGCITDARIQEKVAELAAASKLTPREAQIVELTLSRRSRSEVLAELGVSENTLKTQVKGLLRKTGHDSMTALTRSLLTDLLNPE